MADDFARQLLDALYNPETQPPQQPSRPLREKLAGAAETAATLGSGLLASVPAGLAGLTQMIPTRGRVPSVNRAAQKVEDVQGALTYLPRTEAGQEYLEKTAGALGMLGVPAEILGEKTLQYTGSPAAATAANVLLDPVNFIGIPGSGKAAVATGKALGRAAAAAPRVAAEMAGDLLMPAPRAQAQRGAVNLKSKTPYERSLEQGYEHGWLHGTTGDIRSFDPSRMGEATGAASAKKGFFFVRDPIAPPEEMLKKSTDPKSIELLKGLGIPDEQIGSLNQVSFKGNAAETASGYSSIGGSRTYKEAMKKADAAEKRGDWTEYERQTQIAEDSEMSRMSEAQELVAKYGDRRDEMTDAIQKSLFDRVLPQKEAEQLDTWYKSHMPYGWYNLYSPEQFKGLKKALVSKIGEEKAEPAIKAINEFEKVRAERTLAEKSQEGANVMPVALRYKNPFVYDFKGSTYRDQTYSDLIDQAILNGHDALILRNTYDPGGGPAKLVDIGVVFDPAQIRSTFAKFNPKDIKSTDITKKEGGSVRISDNPDTMKLELAGGGAVAAAKAAAKAAEKSAFTAKQLQSTAEKMAAQLKAENPKLTDDEAMKKGLRLAEQKLKWEKVEKPELEKTYGALEKSKFSDPLARRQRNVPEVVEKRIKETQEFLKQPTKPWTPPRKELQAFERERIKEALEGFPGIDQTKFPRYEPARADLGYIDEIYDDPVNRELIKGQIKRGLPLGGETFYASLYPLKLAALERGIPESKFNEFIYSIAPASARNSIMNEMAVGQFMRDMRARGLSLDEDAVKQEMAAFKEKYGTGLPLMPVHREGVRNVLEGGQDLREMLKADIPTNYKIPTYGTQKAGDFAKSMVLDVHESAGQTRGSRYHPYFTEQGGFGPTEYGAAENKMLGIAGEMGIPGGMAQAGRWFGGGELTGLKSPRGDALDLLEKQTAYTLQGMGINPTPRNIRNYVLDMIEKGEGVLMPWFKKEGMPDVRTEKKEGGAVSLASGGGVGEKRDISSKIAGGGIRGIITRGILGMDPPEDMTPREREIYENAARASAPAQGLGVGKAIFIGAKAKNWNKAAADRFVELEKAGVKPEQIWRETGTFRGADGKLRQEISDVGAVHRNPSQLQELGKAKKEEARDLQLRLVGTPGQKDMFPKALTEAKKPVREQITKLKSEADELMRHADVRGQSARFVLEHPELYKAYPELGSIPVMQGVSGPGGQRGSLIGAGSDLQMAITQQGLRQDPKSTMLHEMQHAVQSLEDMAPGGSAAMAFQDPKAFEILKQLREKASTPMSLDQFVAQYGNFPGNEARYQEYLKSIPKTVKALDNELQRTAAMEYYKRLAGEAEARATQYREGMGPTQRLQEFPYSSYDVLPDDLIVKPARGAGFATAESRSIPVETAAKLASQRADLALRSRAIQELKDQFEDLPQPPKGFLSMDNIQQRMDEIRRREATPPGQQIPLLKKGGKVRFTNNLDTMRLAVQKRK